jgi:GDP-4-dehydro-6-deoxy-D-mannose reductase
MSTTPTAQERILITGGTGFVGTHLVEHLLDASAGEIHVTAFSSDPSAVAAVLPSSQIHEINLTDSAATAALIAEIQPTQVYHLAAIATVSASFDQAEHVLVNNAQLQLSVLNALVKHAPAARVLAVSSAEVYGKVEQDQLPIREDQPLKPVNPYAVSKATQDLLAQSYWLSHQLPIIRVRPFNHIGEGQVTAFVVPAFAKQIVAVERGLQENIQVGNLDSIRDFSDVKDVVRAYSLVLERGTPGDVYNIASGSGTSIGEMLELLIAHSTATVNILQDPAKMRPSDTPRTIGDATKVRALGWEPTHDLRETVGRILEYWRKQE